MKKIAALSGLIWLSLLASCSDKEKTIHFAAISATDLNDSADKSFIPPGGLNWNAFKKMHDSCMGMSFSPNAYFLTAKDSFPLGSVVNKNTMQAVAKLQTFNSQSPNLFTLLNVMVSKPCYITIPFNISVDSLFKKPVILQMPKAYQKYDAELNRLLHTAAYSQAETGSWSYIELTDAVGKLLDTTSNPYLLQYKQALVQPGNMVLIRSGGITNISFHITTSQPVSNGLQTYMSQKPGVNISGWDIKPQLFLIDDTHFELNFTGYFQVMGQFMRAELR